MNNRIKLMPTYLSNQIAAGEVIERPSSVLKELIENSLDAKSTHITITIEQGGLSYLKVADNGKGIHYEDLDLVFTPHATSKISEIADLNNINSFGFRGEALASIQSIARCSLSSAQKDNKHGWQIAPDLTNKYIKKIPSACNIGTCIEVRELFFNTPARRKFLRPERTEYMYIEEVFRNAALSNPQVHWLLIHNERNIRNLPPCLNKELQAKRIALLLGKKFLENSIYFTNSSELQISGWLATKAGLKRHSRCQIIFINNRSIKDRGLSCAIRQAYHLICTDGYYPAYVLFLKIPTHKLDINVHPSKTEVRFENAREIYGNVTQIINSALTECSSLANNYPSKESKLATITDTPPKLATKVIPKQLYETEKLPTVVTILSQRWLVMVANDELWGICGWKLNAKWLLAELSSNYKENKNPPTIPLLFPHHITLSKNLIENIFINIDKLNKWGWDIKITGPESLMINSLPSILSLQLAEILLKEWNIKELDFPGYSDMLFQASLKNGPSFNMTTITTYLRKWYREDFFYWLKDEKIGNILKIKEVIK